MQKRIFQISEGKIQCEETRLLFAIRKIDICVPETQTAEGSFAFSSATGVPLRGAVFSSSGRMSCVDRFFEGTDVQIRYLCHTDGFLPGDCLEGHFTIIVEGNEYILPFEVQITECPVSSSIGPIRSIQDFCRLAEANWKEAYRLFSTGALVPLLDNSESDVRVWYRAFREAPFSFQYMEPFLVGIQEKKPVLFSMEYTHKSFWGIHESFTEMMEIRKEEWGYLCITVSSDSPAVILPKTSIFSDDFTDGRYALAFRVNTEEMHAGNNYVKITLCSYIQESSVYLCLSRNQEKPQDSITSPQKEARELMVKLAGLYKEYQLSRIVRGVFTRESIALLNRLMSSRKNDPFLLLYSAWILLENMQRQDAEWILNDYKRRFELTDTPAHACYLYLQMLLDKDPFLAEHHIYEMERIYQQYPNDEALFFVLLKVRQDYRMNREMKWLAVQNRLRLHKGSFWMILEAVRMLKEDPYLLSEFSEPQLSLLVWMNRHRIMTKGLAVRLFDLASVQRRISPALCPVLELAYNTEPTVTHLQIMCSYFMKGGMISPKYHHWYELAIEKEINLAGIYEAFLSSMEKTVIHKIPRVIQIYFQYETHMPYEKLEVLYQNIIAGKKQEPDLYQKYRMTISDFAKEQLAERHMDDNLSIIYQDIFRPVVLDETSCAYLADILFTYKIVVPNERVSFVTIYQSPLKDPQKLRITDHCAYASLVSDHVAFVFEDLNGNRLTKEISYEVQPLMNIQLYLGKCLEYHPDHLYCILYYLKNKRDYYEFDRNDLDFFMSFLRNDKVERSYKNQKAIQMIHALLSREDKKETVLEMMGFVDLSLLSSPEKRDFLHLLLFFGKMEEAWKLYPVCGCRGLSGEEMESLFLWGSKQEENDSSLMPLAAGCLETRRSVPQAAIYLCNRTDGSGEELLRIFQEARKAGADTFLLEEKLLTQNLFSGKISAKTDTVFTEYYHHHGKDLVLLAYLTARCYQYLMAPDPLDGNVVAALKQRITDEKPLNIICKAAYMKFCAGNGFSTKHEFQMADEIMTELEEEDIYFSFYKKLDIRLQNKHFIPQMVIVEYRSNAENASFHYRLLDSGQDFTTVKMHKAMDGFFVKALPLLFGNTLFCYISEEKDGSTSYTAPRRISQTDIRQEDQKSRLQLLKDMQISSLLKDPSTLARDMKEYQTWQALTQERFQIL